MQHHAYAFADAWSSETLRERSSTDFRVYVQRVPSDLRRSLQPGDAFSVVFGYSPAGRYLDDREYEAVLLTDQVEHARAFVHRGDAGGGVALVVCEFECEGPQYLRPR